MKRILLLPVVAALLSLFSNPLPATPYASGVTNDAGTIRFILNEDSGNVEVTFDDGSVTNDLGALTKGPQSFSLGAATNFQIRVSKTSGNGFVHPTGANSTFNSLTSPRGTILQTSSDSNPLLNFQLPRGLTVNRNPRSPYFGRIYVAQSAPGTSTSNNVTRALGDGIYVLNADQTDALGMGDTPLDGGLAAEFAAGGTASPYRLTIGQDDNLYISDWSDVNGTLFVTDPNLSPGSGANVLPGLKGASVPVGFDRVHGSINQTVVEGSLADGNLTVYTIDEDLQEDRTATGLTQLNSLWRYDIGGTLPPVYNGDPGSITMPALLFTPGGRAGINFAAQTMDMERGANGYFYISDDRQNNGSTSGLIVRDADGGAVWNSSSTTLSVTTSNTLDYCFDSYGVSVSADQKYVVTLRRDARCILIPLTNNVPDISGRLILLTFPALVTARAVRFDAAGNLHVVTSGHQLLRIFSPGGKTLAITGGDATGTNGTFRLVTAPVFRVQPASKYVDWGGSFTLVSYVEGLGEVSYQWQHEGTNIDGATSFTYTKDNFGAEDAGNYTLVASNELGVATSATAVVAVTPPPVILSLVVTAPNEVITTWSSVTGRTYRFQYNPDLNTAGWQDIADLVATNSTTTVTNDPSFDPSAAEQRYYRVLLLP